MWKNVLFDSINLARKEIECLSKKLDEIKSELPEKDIWLHDAVDCMNTNLNSNSDLWINDKEVTWDCRSPVLISKEEGVEIKTINGMSNYTLKENLTDAETKEYTKYGYILIR